jgi:hypothetical protein
MLFLAKKQPKINKPYDPRGSRFPSICEAGNHHRPQHFNHTQFILIKNGNQPLRRTTG